LIYFIANRDRSGIKIGTTIRLSERLKQLAAEHGEGLEVLAVVDGSYETEKGIHRRFSHLRIVNEWFEPGDDLVGFIVSEGREWDGRDEVPLAALGTPYRFSSEAIRWARIASGYTGESMAEYVSRVVAERAREDADRLHADATKKEAEKPAARQGRKGAK
jgi:hypothetical protein